MRTEPVIDRRSRVLPLDGASNFRDVGGYAVAGGQVIRPGLLFRSDHLGQITERDVMRLEPLKLRRVIDLRGVREREVEPCRVPGVEVRNLPIEPTVVQRISEHLRLGRTLSAAEVAEFMRQTYRDFVLHNTAVFAQFFDELLESDGPLVFHCTAGKDRTGFAAALLMLALGSTDEEVLADYLMTNELLVPPPGVGAALSPDVRAVLWGVQPDFLEAAYSTIQREHGGMQAYLSGPIGLAGDRLNALRDRYLM